MSSAISKPVQDSHSEEVVRIPKSLVKIANAFSQLFASGNPPNSYAQLSTENPPISVDNSTKDNEVWVITTLRKLSTSGENTGIPDVIVTIQSFTPRIKVKNMPYAWAPEDPPVHESVCESSKAREWKMVTTVDWHYKFTPTGPKEDILWWTDLQAVPKGPITLEYFEPEFEKRHWMVEKLSDLQDDDEKPADSTEA